jgi:putative RNA 2'-phosphotransferase
VNDCFARRGAGGAGMDTQMLSSVLPRRMAEGGHTVFQAENGVWPINHVRAVFLTLIENPVAGGKPK